MVIRKKEEKLKKYSQPHPGLLLMLEMCNDPTVFTSPPLPYPEITRVVLQMLISQEQSGPGENTCSCVTVTQITKDLLDCNVSYHKPLIYSKNPPTLHSVQISTGATLLA